MCHDPFASTPRARPSVVSSSLAKLPGVVSSGRVVAAIAAADILSKEKTLPPGVKKFAAVDCVLRDSSEGHAMLAPEACERPGKAVAGRVDGLRGLVRLHSGVVKIPIIKRLRL